jgi:hypothetical protein
MFKKILVVLLIALVIIQFFHPKKNISTSPSPNAVAEVYNTPEDVKQILATSCNDCHSNNTVYPWYSKVQPVAWWLNNHINDGKNELNFDDFKNFSPRRQYNKLEEVEKQIKEGDMPLNSYTWIHKNSILTEEQKQKLTAWAESIRNDLKQKYPMDSLLRKKR